MPTLALTESFAATSSHQRRRSSADANATKAHSSKNPSGFEAQARASGVPSRSFQQTLAPVADTLAEDTMSLSRSPSPQRDGGWSSPGLTTPYDGSSRPTSPIRSYPNGSASSVSWARVPSKSAELRGYPSFAPRSLGFWNFRRASAKLPFFNNSRNYADKVPGTVEWRWPAEMFWPSWADLSGK